MTTPRRVVSLVPSATETLLAWGIDVVACTRFCEQPTLVHVGGTKDPDVGAITSLRPDLVVVDREENRREDSDALEAAGLVVHAMHVRSLSDVEPELRTLADAVGAAPMRVGLGAPEPVWASAFVPIWRRPWMTVNAHTYGSTLLAHLGVRNVFGDHASTYPTCTLAEAAERQPDLVLLPSEPYAFRERHITEIVGALPAARVLQIDGQDLFWWGSRTSAALSRLGSTLDVARRRA